MDTLRTNAGIRPATETTDGKIAVRVPLSSVAPHDCFIARLSEAASRADGWTTGGFRFPS